MNRLAAGIKTLYHSEHPIKDQTSWEKHLPNISLINIDPACHIIGTNHQSCDCGLLTLLLQSSTSWDSLIQVARLTIYKGSVSVKLSKQLCLLMVPFMDVVDVVPVASFLIPRVAFRFPNCRWISLAPLHGKHWRLRAWTMAAKQHITSFRNIIKSHHKESSKNI